MKISDIHCTIYWWIHIENNLYLKGFRSTIINFLFRNMSKYVKVECMMFLGIITSVFTTITYNYQLAIYFKIFTFMYDVLWYETLTKCNYTTIITFAKVTSLIIARVKMRDVIDWMFQRFEIYVKHDSVLNLLKDLKTIFFKKWEI